MGGTAAISADIMKSAIDAAASAATLSVSIGASTDTNYDGSTNANDPVRPGVAFSLYFSDDVLSASDGDSQG